jgi:glycosyltransferase involved in cell wall biosynthesis
LSNKPRLLWSGDACVSSGFARCTHKTLETLVDSWDVAVLGIGTNGDPHDYPYNVYPAFSGGDAFGVGRIRELANHFLPNVILIQNDPWNFGPFFEELEGLNVPIVVAAAVDGLNCQGAALNAASHAVFWTSFAEAEARLGGFQREATVIPLGVDLSIYHPTDRTEARESLEITKGRHFPKNAFIVGNVNRNQPRKRLDLTIAYFAEWITTKSIDDAYLFLHVCPTGEKGCDIRQLVRYYGIRDRVILAEPGAGHGVPEAQLARTYNMFDVMLTTTQGEGFGLPTLEGMACGIPQIVPNWSALGDWPGEAVIAVPCTSTGITPGGINVIGGIADRVATIESLDLLYRQKPVREVLRGAGLALAAEPRFHWSNIGQEFDRVLTKVLTDASAPSVRLEAVCQPL